LFFQGKNMGNYIFFIRYIGITADNMPEVQKCYRSL
jgi:hypothetical protein